ncbi:serine hydrolase domain-containing protein [Pseudomarimonas salicorniae]|uniref:Beta-lactamase family protein n=1 Tax=Pseudomarimonas salicorniae TaxID=2933270 RepID=A0ABT0GHR9_9GAMM|nr:serine hydrolase domain-containing protein [Lysobacter sp. CAU 1642]MCK7594091.1 beta-lactamase family protein [Lysobacter sp. CAU 1642]
MSARNSTSHFLLGAILALCSLGAWAGTARGNPAPMKTPAGQSFAPASPAEVGLDPMAIEQLVDQAQDLVDQQDIVGGELLVIKNRRTVLQQSFGFKDREDGATMPINALYCVRSMTKPLTGSAIQLLIDEGKLSLNTRVHTVIAAFGSGQKADITIEHLLNHSSGLPMNILKPPLSRYTNLRAVANEAAQVKLLFEPGSRFHYSDAGSDTLAAVIEAVSGMPAERFIQQRLLDPLAMHDSITLLADRPDLMASIPSAYSGGSGSWSKHWKPVQPLFPLFLGSQGLYSTPLDYARFLAMWMDQGQVGGQRILSQAAIERGLTPGFPLPSNRRREEGSLKSYAQQWVVQVRQEDAASGTRAGSQRVQMFGHDGSDGTFAWAYPEQDLMVLFFTQSRGTLAGLTMETAVKRLLVDAEPPPAGRLVATPADALSELAGLYWDQDVEHAYYVIAPRGERLSLDRPGGMHLLFRRGEQAGRFVAEANPKVWIEFIRDAAGRISAMRTFFGERVELDPRHQRPVGLPLLSEVISRVQRAHRMDLLAQRGVVELSGSLDYLDRSMRGKFNTRFDGERSRTDVRIGRARQSIAVSGSSGWMRSSETGEQPLDARMAEQERLGQPNVLWGDWTQHYAHVEVLKRLTLRGQPHLLVLAISRLGSSSTFFVEETSGRVIRKDELALVPGVGMVGVQSLFEDFQDVGGMQIAFRTTLNFVHRQIGRVRRVIRHAAVGQQVADTAFLPTGADGP